MIFFKAYGQKGILIMLNQLIEYMKLHLISLNQDWEAAKNNEPLNEDEYDPSDDYFEGAIAATEHLLSVATDIMNNSNERVNR